METAGERHDWQYRRLGLHGSLGGWRVSRPTAAEEYADAEFSIVVDVTGHTERPVGDAEQPIAVRANLAPRRKGWRAFLVPVISLLVSYLVAFALLSVIQGNRSAQAITAIVSIGLSLLAYAIRLKTFK